MDRYYLAPLEPDGKAPKTRVSDAQDAQRIYERLYNNYNDGRGRINAKVAGAIDGRAPIEQIKLDKEGLGWMTNVNWRLLEGDVNSAQVPYYSIFSDVPQYASVVVKMPKLGSRENNILSKIISEEHTKLCNKWRGFDYNFQLSISNVVKYGSGPIYFPNKRDFRFKAAPNGFVFVPDETTQDLDELPLLYIYQEWEVTNLYAAIESPKASEMGWNVPFVKKVLINWCNEYSGFTRSRSWEYWQQKIREHDAYLDSVVPRIRTAWGHVREFDSKITRYLIGANQGLANQEYFFHKEREYDNWSQIIHPFFAEIGNGNWNGVKGIGIKAYNQRDAQNKLKNRLLDAALVGSQVLLQAADEKALESFQVGQMGPYSIINKELTPMQMPLMSTLDKPLAIDRMFEQDLARNIGSTRQRMGDPQSVQPVSSREAGVIGMKEAQLSQATQTMWYRQMDDLYTEQFERLKNKTRMPSESNPYNEWEKLVSGFHKACEERGVPFEAFKHVVSVKATRSIGRGSPMAKQEEGMQIYGLLRNDPNSPQETVISHFRNLLCSIAGYEYVQSIWPEEQIMLNPTNDESKAQDENAGMLLGVPPIWTGQQNNYAHATTHLQFTGAMMQAVMQGQGDLAAYLKFAQVALPHIQQTLQAMSGPREGNGSAYQQLTNAFQQVVAETKGIEQRFQEQQQAQAEEQQRQQQLMAQAQQTGQMQDPETQLGMARIQADAQIQGMKAQSDVARKTAKTRADIQAKAAKTSQELRVKALTTAQEMQIKQKQSNAPQSKKA